MTKYNLLPYSIVVCVVVFVLLLIGYLYYSLYRYKLQAIENGLEDNEIIKEFMEACNIKPAAWYAAFEKIDTDYPGLLSE